jgi:hypothetical protein
LAHVGTGSVDKRIGNAPTPVASALIRAAGGGNEMNDCLHCQISDLVNDYVAKNESIDLVDVAAKVAESLAEVILLAPDEEQAALMAEVLRHLGHVFLEKSGVIEGGSERTH